MSGKDTRVFEDVYHRYLSKVMNYSPAIAGSLIALLSVVKLTYLYTIEAAGLAASLKLSGLRLRRLIDYLKIAVVITGLVSLMEAALHKPPLNLVVVSANLASSLSYVIGGSPLRWAAPNIMGAGYYLLTSNYLMGLVSLIYVGFIPLLVYAFNRLVGVDGAGLVRGFVREGLEGPGLFERQLEALPLEERELKAHIFLIKIPKTGKRVVLVITDAHPGPFGRVGGSMIISLLKDELEGRGYKVLFLHGVGGHENDIVRGEDARRFVEEVRKAVEMMDKEPEPVGDAPSAACKPSLIDTANFSITTFCLNGRRIAIVSAKHKSTDDLPSSLSTVEDKLDVILVDAQNTYMVDNGYDAREWLEIEEALRRARGEEGGCGGIRIGFAELPAYELDAGGLEIGPLGVRALALECDGERAALLVLDGNNMRRGLREKIIRRARELADVNVAEVSTTDNHSLVGLRGKRGYRVIGETVDSDEITRAVEEALSRAIRGLDMPAVKYAQVRLRARVLGEMGFEALRKAVSRTPIVASIYLASLLLAPLPLA